MGAQGITFRTEINDIALRLGLLLPDEAEMRWLKELPARISEERFTHFGSMCTCDRQSGRSTNAILKCLALAQRGIATLLFCQNQLHARDCRVQLKGWANLLGIKGTLVNAASISQVPMGMSMMERFSFMGQVYGAEVVDHAVFDSEV